MWPRGSRSSTPRPFKYNNSLCILIDYYAYLSIYPSVFPICYTIAAAVPLPPFVPRHSLSQIIHSLSLYRRTPIKLPLIPSCSSCPLPYSSHTPFLSLLYNAFELSDNLIKVYAFHSRPRVLPYKLKLTLITRSRSCRYRLFIREKIVKPLLVIRGN